MSKQLQQVLIMHTAGRFSGLRQEAVGWTGEDPRGAKSDGPVGICGAWWSRRENLNRSYCYPDPLRALAGGWKLLAPPTDLGDGEHEWWFTREVGG